jgi:F-type H+-transporting ATPase subunit delta
MKDGSKIAHLLFDSLKKATTDAEEQAVMDAFIATLKRTHTESQGAKIIADLEVLLQKSDNVLRPIVTTATAMTSAQCESLIAQLKQQHGASEVQLDQRIDPTVLGGLSVKIDDMLYDATLKKKLHTLTNTLTQ